MQSDTDRFWRRINKTDSCWLWTGAKASMGYGVLRWLGKRVYAHRLVYELTYGPIPDGLFICHHCDNPPCCNPQHLYAGTQRDNMRDRDRRGRGLKGRSRKGKPTNAKITAEIAEAIRNEPATTRKDIKRIAEKYRLHWASIYRIRNNQIWQDEARPVRTGRHNDKITLAIARAIRQDHAATGQSTRALGRKYGLSATGVRLILRGVRWKEPGT
jgi:Mor family transcriptional regulator